MNYVPNPINVDKITIPSSMQEDIERISRDVHEVWAQQRILDGWGYGSVFDSEKHEHPCLVEYNHLPEVEKDMDRAIVVRTIELLLWMGYQIKETGGNE